MDIKINKDKFKKLLFKYLDSQDELEYAEDHGDYYESNVKEFFYSNYTDDDTDPYFDFIFAYYQTPEGYEDVNGVTSPYESSTYPLIELDTSIYKKIIGLFGDLYAPQLVLEWLNKRYDLNAVSIAEN